MTCLELTYHYTDHTSTRLSTCLGNIRLSYGRDPETNEVAILKEQHYYPFACPELSRRGLEHKGYVSTHRTMGLGGLGNPSVSIVPVRNYLDDSYRYAFGGKEEQPELGLNWLDFHARNYDAALGRWMNVDPLAEKGPQYSPYSFSFNNPVVYFDPDGQWPYPFGVKYIRDKYIKFKLNTNKAYHSLGKSNRNRVEVMLSGREKTDINIPNTNINIDMAQDIITINNSLNTISNELGSVAKEVTRDAANLAETVGDGMVIVAPATGPAAPAVAVVGAKVSGIGTITNVGLDLIDGDKESAIKRSVIKASTFSLNALVKNAPEIDEATSRIIDAVITSNENVITPAIESNVKNKKH